LRGVFRALLRRASLARAPRPAAPAHQRWRFPSLEVSCNPHKQATLPPPPPPPPPPTHTLTAARWQVVSAIGDYMKVKVHACVGGTVIREDLAILRDGVHVVVGTPGRVYDMIQR